jgi:predicted nucleic acid-binding protein
MRALTDILIVDTWAWYAMGNRRQPEHVQVQRVYRETQKQVVEKPHYA